MRLRAGGVLLCVAIALSACRGPDSDATAAGSGDGALPATPGATPKPMAAGAGDAAPDRDAADEPAEDPTEDPDTIAAIAATTEECARAVSARMRRVCGSDELRRLHWANREHFALLRERFPEDARTVELAAERQLEACPDAACLAGAYRDWETYLGDNYDLFDAY